VTTRIGRARPFPTRQCMCPGWLRARPSLRRRRGTTTRWTAGVAAAAGELSSWHGRGPHYQCVPPRWWCSALFPLLTCRTGWCALALCGARPLARGGE
jgi:hypothetical protein